MKKDVAIIMGSVSDDKVMDQAAKILKEFQISFEKTVVSAHRTPEYMQEFALTLEERGTKVVIAGAGGAAHLPGMVAALCSIPVIGVPIGLKYLSGMDSLLSIVSMPKGVPVATVAIDNATNAALLAARILGISQPHILQALKNYQITERDKSLNSSANLIP
ncbi:MAG: 5-(carboxyamino)imidazole ribonucleotide mutase [Proteobacteria bacterium]|nr:5-(carboxyamino)imidazole ribonucleotide mutase [Pseudomonadota bacterium]